MSVQRLRSLARIYSSITSDFSTNPSAAKFLPGHVICRKGIPQYILQCKIGHGTFSVVYSALDLSSSTLVAIKFLHQTEIADDQFTTEIKAFRCVDDQRNQLPSPAKEIIGIPKLYDDFKVDGHHAMVMEHVGRSLYTVTCRIKPTTMQAEDCRLNFLECVIDWTRKTLYVLAFLHKIGLMYRDLKPENITVDMASQRVCVVDMGSVSPLCNKRLAPYVQSRYYRAPEVLFNWSINAVYGQYDHAIDIWSLGCVLMELLSVGQPIFPGHDEDDQRRLICRFLGPTWETKMYRERKQTLLQWLIQHPKSGWDAQTVQHPKLMQCLHVATLMLAYAHERPTAMMLLHQPFFHLEDPNHKHMINTLRS